ncbi:hypothetical protein RCL1_008863 [Eukaryota sp. TZLM3-RCL]
MSDQLIVAKRAERDLLSFIETSSNHDSPEFWTSLISHINTLATNTFSLSNPSTKILSFFRNSLVHLSRCPSLRHIDLVPHLSRVFPPHIVAQLRNLPLQSTTQSSLTSFKDEFKSLKAPYFHKSSRKTIKSRVNQSILSSNFDLFTTPFVSDTEHQFNQSNVDNNHFNQPNSFKSRDSMREAHERLLSTNHVQSESSQSRMIKTSDDAIRHFINHPEDSIKFVFLIDSTLPDDLCWDPYSLLVVSRSKAKSCRTYYTLSGHGVVRISPGNSSDPTEFTSLPDWIKAGSVYRLLVSMKFFGRNLELRVLLAWRRWVRFQRFNANRAKISKNLFKISPTFASSLSSVYNQIISFSTGTNFSNLNFNSKYLNEDELYQQHVALRHQSITKLNNLRETIISSVKLVFSNLHAKTLDGKGQNHDNSDSDDDINHKILSMVQVKQARLRKRRLLSEAKYEEARFYRFISLIDYMIISNIFSLFKSEVANLVAILSSFNDVDARRTGVLPVTLGFEKGNQTLVFTPSDVEVGEIFVQILAEIESKLDEIPLISSSPFFSSLFPYEPSLSLSSVISTDSAITESKLSVFNQIRLSFKRAEVAVEPFKSWKSIFDFGLDFSESCYSSAILTWDNKRIHSELVQLESWISTMDQTSKKPINVGLLVLEKKKLRDSLVNIPITALEVLKISARKLCLQLISSLSETLRTHMRILSSVPSDLKEFALFLGEVSQIRQSMSMVESKSAQIDDLYVLLQKFNCGITVSESSKFSALRSSLLNFDTVINEAQKSIDSKLPSMREELAGNVSKMESTLLKMIGDVYGSLFVDPKGDPQYVLEKLEILKGKLSNLVDEIQLIRNQEVLLGRNPSDFVNFNQLSKIIDTRISTWKLVDDWSKKSSDWMNDDVRGLDIDKVKNFVENSTIFTENYLLILKNDPVLLLLSTQLSEFQRLLISTELLSTSHLQDHHWSIVYNKMGLVFGPTSRPSIKLLQDNQIFDDLELISQITSLAQKEFEILSDYQNLVNWWKKVVISVDSSRTFPFILTLSTFDKVIKEQKSKINTLIGQDDSNTLIKEDLVAFQESLIDLTQLFSTITTFQDRLAYFSSVFSKKEIAEHLPRQSDLFYHVINDWSLIVSNYLLKSNYFSTFFNTNHSNSLVKQLNNLLLELENSAKYLDEYLKTKREECSLLGFYSDEELIGLLSLINEPVKISKICTELFPTIDHFCFENNAITSFVSKFGEKISFTSPLVLQSNFGLEFWISLIQKSIKEAVQEDIRACLEDYNVGTRVNWVKNHSEMSLFVVEQILITKILESTLSWSNDQTAVYQCIKNLRSNFDELLAFSRGNLSDLESKKVNLLLNVNKYYLTLLEDVLVSKNSSKIWENHVKYFYNNTTHTVNVKLCNIEVEFSNEYLGNGLIFAPKFGIQNLTKYLANISVSRCGIYVDANISCEMLKSFANTIGRQLYIFDLSTLNQSNLIRTLNAIKKSSIFGLFNCNLIDCEAINDLLSTVNNQRFESEEYGLLVSLKISPKISYSSCIPIINFSTSFENLTSIIYEKDVVNQIKDHFFQNFRSNFSDHVIFKLLDRFLKFLDVNALSEHNINKVSQLLTGYGENFIENIPVFLEKFLSLDENSRKCSVVQKILYYNKIKNLS